MTPAVTRYLVATRSVHTTAAACDYLLDRLAGDDRVHVLTVDEGGGDDRDGEDALNVARTRLAVAAVETVRREGDPAATILSVADEYDVDEVVIGPRSGAPDAGNRLGTAARGVLEGADRPVVVVPLPDLE